MFCFGASRYRFCRKLNERNEREKGSVLEAQDESDTTRNESGYPSVGPQVKMQWPTDGRRKGGNPSSTNSLVDGDEFRTKKHPKRLATLHFGERLHHDPHFTSRLGSNTVTQPLVAASEEDRRVPFVIYVQRIRKGTRVMKRDDPESGMKRR